jgi:hypothetical protein
MPTEQVKCYWARGEMNECTNKIIHAREKSIKFCNLAIAFVCRFRTRKCPMCGVPLSVKNKWLYCENKNCVCKQMHRDTLKVEKKRKVGK